MTDKTIEQMAEWYAKAGAAPLSEYERLAKVKREDHIENQRRAFLAGAKAGAEKEREENETLRRANANLTSAYVDVIDEVEKLKAENAALKQRVEELVQESLDNYDQGQRRGAQDMYAAIRKLIGGRAMPSKGMAMHEWQQQKEQRK